MNLKNVKMYITVVTVLLLTIVFFLRLFPLHELVIIMTAVAIGLLLLWRNVITITKISGKIFWTITILVVGVLSVFFNQGFVRIVPGYILLIVLVIWK
ncbi:MAG: hypothetical protein ACRCV7_00345 [Culicoidibacterales bacterium]